MWRAELGCLRQTTEQHNAEERMLPPLPLKLRRIYEGTSDDIHYLRWSVDTFSRSDGAGPEMCDFKNPSSPFNWSAKVLKARQNFDHLLSATYVCFKIPNIHSIWQFLTDPASFVFSNVTSILETRPVILPNVVLYSTVRCCNKQRSVLQFPLLGIPDEIWSS